MSRIMPANRPVPIAFKRPESVGFRFHLVSHRHQTVVQQLADILVVIHNEDATRRSPGYSGDASFNGYLRGRVNEIQLRSLSVRVARFNRASMQLDERAHDRQTQTQPFGARPRLRNPEKTDQKSVPEIPGNTGPGIEDRHACVPVIVLAHRHGDAPSSGVNFIAF